jgi:hypothetical protein
MGLKTNMVPLEEQIRVVDVVMKNLRIGGRAGNMIAAENYEGLKAVAAGAIRDRPVRHAGRDRARARRRAAIENRSRLRQR